MGPNCRLQLVNSMRCSRVLAYSYSRNRAKGLAEMFRVARPQAKVMISSWAPAEGPIEAMYRIVRETLPDLPFQHGRAPLGTKDEIARELTEAGFTHLHVESVPVRFSYDSAYDYWRKNSRASAPLVATRRRVQQKDWPAVETRILDTLASFPGACGLRSSRMDSCRTKARILRVESWETCNIERPLRVNHKKWRTRPDC